MTVVESFYSTSHSDLEAVVLGMGRSSSGTANPPHPSQQTGLSPLPSAIVFQYWQESDGTFGGTSPLLGVSAIGETLPDLFVSASEAVDQFWAILNAEFSTLSSDLKALLRLRNLGLRFEQG